MTKFGKKLLSFFAVFFLTLCVIGCEMSNEVSGREGLDEAKANVKWLLENFSFGDVINDVVKEPVIGNVGIAEDLDGNISENDLRNGTYSEFMYGMSASFESSNPEVMEAKWVTYKKRAYVYGDPANPDKITGIETQETTVLEFVVNRPAADQEDVNVDITIKVKAPYQIGDQTYYAEGERTLTFKVLKKAASNTMTVGELEDYIIANWTEFTNGSLFKDENGNDLNVSIEGIVTEQVWGDGYSSHSFTMADDNGNGIYVYGPQSPVNIGDRVIVTGKPATYNGTIQIGLDSTVEIVSEASEYVPAEETTIEEWYAKYPTQGTDHKVPGKRVKVSGLFIQKTVDGYTNYAIQSTESDHFIQIYYKSYGAYEEELLKSMLGKAAEFEIAMYYCHNNGYWVGILNNYDYQPKLIEMSAEDKLTADVAGIKPALTVKNGETVDLPTGTLANGTVLSGWTADKEGYINLETLVANLGSAKEDVKVTLTATATNGEASQEVKVEVTIKYVKGEIAEKTVKELIELTEEMLETFKVTGTIVQWGNKIGTPDEAPTMYGNFILQGEDGSQIVVYGSTASESALAWDAAAGKYKYTNAKDFLTNELTSQLKLGDKVELLVVRTSYNGNPQLNAVVLGIKNDAVEVKHHVLGVYQASLGKTLYVTGEVTNDRYLATTEDINLAAKVYIEEVEGGSRFYILEGETKKYLDTYMNSANKISLRFDAASQCVYTYNEATKAWVTNVDGTDYYFGTYSTFETLSASKTSYITAENTGVSQFPGFLQPVEGQVEEEKEVAHLLGVYQASLGKTLYVTGNVANDRYLETTTDKALAAKVYIEEVEGGSRFYILEGETKKYLDTYMNSANKISLRFDAASQCVYTYNETTKAWVTNVDGTDYYFGTYSTFETLSASKTSYITAENTGVSQFPGFLEKAEAGQTPEPPVHEHKFVEGKCECGELDPNYQPPVVGPVEGTTVTAKMGDVAAANGWTNGVMYNSFNLNDKVSATLIAEGGSGSYAANTGKYYSTGTTWRMYQSDKNATLTIAAVEGLSVVSVKVTYTPSNNGTLVLNGANVASDEVVLVNAQQVVFTAGNTGSATNGQVRITAIEVVYGEAGQTPEPPVHEHKFVEGKCECGEVDPNYVAPEQPTTEVVKEGVAYLLGFNQVSLGKVFYATGNVANVRYLEMTEDAAAAAKVYAEKAEGGYKFYILDGSTKKYLDTYMNSANKISLQFSAESNCVYTYNADTKAWATTVDGSDYYFGTYSTFNTMSASKTSYITAENTGVSQFPGFFEEAKGETPEPPVHEHEFVNGECACGEKDPNYVPPVVGPTENATVTAPMGDVAAANGWTNGVMYNSFNLNDKVSATLIAEGGSGSYAANTGKYYSTGTTWRMYQSDKNATLTIAAVEGCTIVSVKVTYTPSNNGTLVLNGTNVATDTVVDVNAQQVVFTAGNTGSATNGQVRITAIEVVYAAAGGETPEPPVHEHEFVEGKCACGEVDPNYQAPSYEEPATTNKTVAELIALSEEMNASYKVTGKVVLWGNKLTSTDTAPTMYGNFVLEGEDGSKIVVYGATASASALKWNAETGKYTYANAKDFITNATTAAIALGDTVELLVVRTSYNGNPQLNAIVLNVTPAAPEHEHNFVEGKCECGEEDPNYIPPTAEPELFLTVGFEGYTSNTTAKSSVSEGGVTFKSNSVAKMYTDNTPGSVALKFNNSSSSGAGFEATGFEKAISKMTFKAATWNSAVTLTIVGTTADGQTITVKVSLANTAKAFAAEEFVVEFETPVVSFTLAADKRAFVDDMSFYG